MWSALQPSEKKWKWYEGEHCDEIDRSAYDSQAFWSRKRYAVRGETGAGSPFFRKYTGSFDVLFRSRPKSFARMKWDDIDGMRRLAMRKARKDKRRLQASGPAAFPTSFAILPESYVR